MLLNGNALPPEPVIDPMQFPVDGQPLYTNKAGELLAGVLFKERFTHPDDGGVYMKT